MQGIDRHGQDFQRQCFRFILHPVYGDDKRGYVVESRIKGSYDVSVCYLITSAFIEHLGVRTQCLDYFHTFRYGIFQPGHICLAVRIIASFYPYGGLFAYKDLCGIYFRVYCHLRADFACKC